MLVLRGVVRLRAMTTDALCVMSSVQGDRPVVESDSVVRARLGCTETQEIIHVEGTDAHWRVPI